MRLIAVSILALNIIGCFQPISKSSKEVLPQTELPAYDLSIEDTARASRLAMESLGWKIDFALTREPIAIVGHVPPTWNSDGEKVEVFLLSDPGEKTRVNAASTSKDFIARYDWGRNEKNIKQFYETLDGIIASHEKEHSSTEIQFRPMEAIIVTTGSLSRPYNVLGEVHVDTTDTINVGSVLYDSFRSPLAVAVGGSTPEAHAEQMNIRLKAKARALYRDKIDAVINVTYRTDHDGEVYASGLAVQFIEEKKEVAAPVPSTTPSLETRLRELKQLREKNLITDEEYYEKRSKLLEEF